MEVKNRMHINMINGQENVFTNKMKTTQGLKPAVVVQKRAALGEISNNVPLQPLGGKGLPEKDKKPAVCSLRPVTRSYKNVQAKVDTRLATKPAVPAAGSTVIYNDEKVLRSLRREESTAAMAGRAGAGGITSKLRQTKISGVQSVKYSSKENLAVKDAERKTRPIKVEVTGKSNPLQPLIHKQSACKELKSPKRSGHKDSYSTELLDGVEDIDAADETSPILMGVYIKDIYSYLKDLEIKYMIKPQHLDGQVVVTSKMRAMLIDWLVQVHNQFSLMLETLHLTVAIIDRYLQVVKTIKRPQIQLVGITAMFIASKYEEMFAPDIQDFVYIADNTYSRADILQCERSILVKLDFSLGRPLPLHFVRRYIKAASVRARNHQLAKYLIDLCLVEYQMAHYRPSELAAAAVCLSISLLSADKAPAACWTPTLHFYSGYTFPCIAPIVTEMAAILCAADTCRYKAVTNKYNLPKYGKVSSLPELKSAKKLAKSPAAL